MPIKLGIIPVSIAVGLLAASYVVATKISGWHDDQGATAAGIAPTVIAKRQDFVVDVNLIGELDAANGLMVTSAVGGDRGKIIDIVPDGTEVRAGDVLVRLDPTPFEENVALLEADLVEQQTRVQAAVESLQWETNQIEREIREARYEAQLAEIEMQTLEEGEGPLEVARLESAVLTAENQYNEQSNYAADLVKLVERGYVDQVEVSLAQKSAEEAGRKLEIAKAQLASLRDFVLPSKVKKATIKLEQARQGVAQLEKGKGHRLGRLHAVTEQSKASFRNLKAKLERAKADLDNTIIRAPSPGLVVLREEFRDGQKRKPRIGDVVLRNQPLLYLPDISKMIVKTKIREIDLHKIDVGSSTQVKVDAYPNLTLTGSVVALGALAETSSVRGDRQKYFKLTSSILETEGLLRPGMTARVSVAGTQVRDAIVVPSAAIFSNDVATMVYREEDGQILGQAVQIGHESDDLAEIESGVDVGDVLHLVPPETGDGESRRATR